MRRPEDPKKQYIREFETSLLSRRDVVKWIGTGAVIVMVSPDPVEAAWNEEDDRVRPGRIVSTRVELHPDGTITVATGKMEMGQGARTLITQAAAEEMHTTPDRVRLIMGDTELCPDDNGTWGSLTSPQLIPLVRKAVAIAYGALHNQPPRLTDPKDWKVLGTSLPALDGRNIVTGRHRYASDRIPAANVLHAKIVRPAAYRADLVSYSSDKNAGEKALRAGNLLAVTAPTAREAERRAREVQAVWRTRPIENPDYKKHAEKPVLDPASRYPAIVMHGDLWKGFLQPAKTHEAAYTLPNIAPAALEPRAAIAEWKGDRLTLQTGTQAPFMIRKLVAQYFQLPEENIRVISPDCGSGFGGKQRAEVEIEAARVAKLAGRPVRVAWTRQEEFERSYVRPAALIEVKSAMDAAGWITGWEFRNYNAGASSLKPPYAIPHYECCFHKSKGVVEESSYRSLAAVSNTFARETHIDELAVLRGEDPLEFRLRNLDDARLREATERAAERFGYARAKNAGVALNIEKDARLALFVALDVEGDRVRLERMVCAFDPGAVLNPDNLRNQIEGALVQGLGAALFEQVRFDSERLLNPRFSQYRVPRFADVPPIEVILIDRREIPSAGAGESPITPVAPAIGNALFRVTGRRLRALPFEPALRAKI